MAAPDPVTHDRVYRNLKADIFAGQFLPGSKLTATRIAKRYTASITPVREAMYRLVGEGLVKMTPQGFHVTSDSPTMLIDILDLSQKLLVIGLQRWRGGTDMPPVTHEPQHPIDAQHALLLLENVLVHLFATTGNQAVIAWGRQANERLRWIRLFQCRYSQRARLECISLYELAARRDRTRLGRQILAHHRRCAKAIHQQFLGDGRIIDA